MAAQLAKAYGGVWQNDAWTKYVNLVGRSLVPKCDRPDIKYRFAILNSKEVNAFSCPGGYIFITKGLLKRCKNEAELACVSAHEIVHTAKRHVENGLKNQKVAGAMLEGGLGIAQAQGAKLSAQQLDTIKKLAGQATTC